MNCEQAEMLLYLRRPGETSGAEKDELALHLEQCDRCRSLAARIDAVGPAVEALRTTVPRPGNPEELTRSIMNRIPRGHSAARRVFGLESLLDAAAAPAVRYACAAVVVIALGSFTWHKISLLNLRHFGDHLEIALREYNGFLWSEPKTFNIQGISIRTIPSVFKDRLLFFQLGFFAKKYYVLSGDKIEGPYTISKPFFYSVNLWKVLFVSFSSWIIFFLFIFLLSLLIRRYKLKTWIMNKREHEFGSLFRRAHAWSIDLLIITIPAVAPFYFVLKDGVFFENPFQYVGLFFYSLMVMFLGNFFYHSLSEGLWGKTVGKKSSLPGRSPSE